MKMKRKAHFTTAWRVAAAATCSAVLGIGGCGAPPDASDLEDEASTEDEGEALDIDAGVDPLGAEMGDGDTDATEDEEASSSVEAFGAEALSSAEAFGPEAFGSESVVLPDGPFGEYCEYVPPPGDEFCKYATKMWDWGWKISKIFEPNRDVDIGAMANDVANLKASVMQLREAGRLADIRFDTRTLDDLARDVDAAYANVESALQTVLIYPGNQTQAEVAEGQARTACNILDEEKFHELKIYPWLTRFEPRIATPTFVIAVTTWLGILEATGLGMNAAKDEILRQYANHLAGITSKVRSSVTCSTIQDQVDLPCVGGDDGCELHECHNYIECSDAILNQTTYHNYTTRSGTCAYINTPAPNKEYELEHSRYSANTHDALVAQWRAYADQPNRNLALGRPAFDIPSTWVPPDRAVDGNTNGDFWFGSVTHTDATSQPWWWVDLGSVQHIDEIRLFNRTDCCSSRLSHYQIVVSADSTDGWDGSWHVIVDRSWQQIAEGDGTPQVHPVDTWARWVAVTKTNLDYLSLAEVQVMAH